MLPCSNPELKTYCFYRSGQTNSFPLSTTEATEIDRLVAKIFGKEMNYIKELELLKRKSHIEKINSEIFQRLFDLNTGELMSSKLNTSLLLLN